ncbi:AEC family transporter [Ignatzschineria cameli]|uniref:AEC family transporter n=1 Tax=Ignatzschineria cameli TaxID=2182793 RepID=UPI000D6038F9|nr:AEC family transporter [Ignatzschineria cameli]PWD87446.1 permease [Ignatzschineria cameli]
MMMTVLDTTLPIVVTLLLGFFAAWHHDFTSSDAPILNRMVLTYAVPMAIFAGTISTSREYLIESLPLFTTITAGVVITYIVIYFISRLLLRLSLSASALVAVAVAGPAVPFFGPAILEGVFGTSGAVPMAIGSIVINVTIVPFTVYLLTVGKMKSEQAENDKEIEDAGSIFIEHLKETVQKPLVWAPILAVIIVFSGLDLSSLFGKSLNLLGSSASGVALFASGIMLAAYKIRLDFLTWFIVILKNIAAPAAIYFAASALGLDHKTVAQAVITMAIPAMPIIVVFAIEYKVAEKNMPSALLLSTILSPLTIGGFIYLLAV